MSEEDRLFFTEMVMRALGQTLSMEELARMKAIVRRSPKPEVGFEFSLIVLGMLAR